MIRSASWALIALLSANAVIAQPATTATAAVTRVATDSLTQGFTVGGLQVILRQTRANDVVAANLYLLGGTRQVPAAKAGLEPFLLAISERGTRAYPRELLRAKMAHLGTSIGGDASPDWTVFGLRSTLETLDSTWAIFADRLMRPRLDTSDVEFVREQLLSGLRQRGDSPDERLDLFADSVAFHDHPYGIQPEGTAQSISSITVGDLRKYQAEQMVTSRMLLVVVGNVTRERVERLVRGTIGKLPAGTYQWTTPAVLPEHKSEIIVEERNLPTNYILGYYNGPPASSRDAAALRVATAVLSGRLFAEVRSKRNLTYAVNAPFVDRALTAGGLYVTTVDPEQTLSIMRDEIRALQTEQLDPSGLERLVQQFLTEYFLDNETNAAQASFLARAQLYRGDWQAAERFVDELRAVTPSDVQRAARDYMHNIRFAYIGDPQKVSRGAAAKF